VLWCLSVWRLASSRVSFRACRYGRKGLVVLCWRRPYEHTHTHIREDLLLPVLDALPCVVATHEVWCNHLFDGNITPTAAQPMADTIAVQFVFSFACSSIMQGMAASRRW
jgi:hypothetical protein